MSLLVIFGAGASYDSDPDRLPPELAHDRPPLAQDLFVKSAATLAAISDYAPVASIIGELRDAVTDGVSIEIKLRELADQDGPYWPLQQLALQYYLKRVVFTLTANWHKTCAGATNYARLCQALILWSRETTSEVHFVTFNYDTLLESALSTFGRRFRDERDYVLERPPLGHLFKVHGSCNWSQLASLPIEHGNPQSPSEYSEAMILERVQTLNRPPVEEICAGSIAETSLQRHEVRLPAIAIPTVGKSQYVLPGGHHAILRSVLDATEVILCLGWRGQDPHFINDLSAALRPGVNLLVSNGSAAWDEEAIQNLRFAGLDKVHYESLGLGFSQVVRTPAVLETLKERLWPK
jgi:hypothetical protein